MQILRIRRTVRSVRRYREIIQILLKYGFDDLIDRFRMDGASRRGWKRFRRKRKQEIIKRSRPERIRLVLEELGPTFIKLGQMLSTQIDLIPQEYIRELEKLQDDVKPFPVDQVREIIYNELNAPVESLFSFFEETPLASASIAQVHRARTVSGLDVAVKVRRPGIRKKIQDDIQILMDLATLASKGVSELAAYDPAGLVYEFKSWLNKELDFYQEARNIDRFGRNFENDATICVPEVQWDRSTQKVLTMTYIDGINIDDIKKLDQAGMDRKIIALNGANAVLKQIFEHGFFHGDPHPGNILVLEGNIIAPLDFGLMGSLDIDLMEQLGDLVRAVVNRDGDRIVRLLLGIGLVQDEMDHRTLKSDLLDLVNRYYHASLAQVRIEVLFEEIASLTAKHHVRVPRNVYLMGKVLAAMESTGKRLDPDFDAVELLIPYARKIVISRFDPRRIVRNGSRMLEDYSDLLSDLPDNARRILLKMRKGEFGFNLNHQGLDRFIREMDKSTNRLSFSMIIAALVIASSLIIQLNMGPLVLGLSVFGLTGFLIAAFLGLWLVIAIMRSGRL